MFLYWSWNKHRLLPYTALTVWFCIAEVESVYSAVRTETHKTDTFRIWRVKEKTDFVSEI